MIMRTFKVDLDLELIEKLANEGKKNEEIADALGVSFSYFMNTKTKRRDIQDILDKARADNPVQYNMKKLDLPLIERLAHVHCTDDEIAYCLDTSPDAFRALKDHHPELVATLAKGRADGKRKIRQYMWDSCAPTYDSKGKMIKKGDPILLIWLSKNILGFKDSSEKHTINENIDVKSIADLAMQASKINEARKIVLELPDGK